MLLKSNFQGIDYRQAEYGNAYSGMSNSVQSALVVILILVAILFLGKGLLQAPTDELDPDHPEATIDHERFDNLH